MDGVGPYRLGRTLGSGAMGIVRAARHTLHGTRAAVKLVRSSATALGEIQRVAALDHRHVVRILDYGETGDVTWFAMPLAAHASSDVPPDRWFATRALLSSMLAALAHTHARGILHRDVKPSNLLWTRDAAGSRWVLADFGISVAGFGPGSVSGTPLFMAPEQFDPSAVLGPQTDLYALGCLATYLVSGHAPFEAHPSARQRDAHRFLEPSVLSPRFDVPAGFDAWRLRLLEKLPADRFRLAADALVDLERLGAPVPGSGRPTGHASADAQTWSFDDEGAPEPRRQREAPSPPSAPEPSSRPTAMRRLRASPQLLDLRVAPLVGRDAEVEHLRAQLERARSDGAPRVVRLLGPPGSGRTRLADGFASLAEERGWALRGGEDPLSVVRSADRPVVARAVEGSATLDALLACRHPLLVLVPGERDPAPDDQVLSPLRAQDVATIIRNLLDLEDALSHGVAAAASGIPGVALDQVRAWASAEALVDSPFGFTLRADVPIAQWVSGAAVPLARSLDAAEPVSAQTTEAVLGVCRPYDDPVESLCVATVLERAGLSSSASEKLRVRALMSLGLLARAAAVCHLVTERCREQDEGALADALLGEAHLIRHVGGEAAPLLEEAERVTNDPTIRARARAIRGSMAIVDRRYAEAIELLAGALEILDDLGTDAFRGTAQMWLANAHLESGLADDAVRIAEACRQTFLRVANPTGESHALGLTVSACLRAGRLDRARAAIEALAEVSQRIGSPWVEADLFEQRARLAEHVGDLDDAERWARLAVERIDQTEIASRPTPILLARILLKAGRASEAASLLQGGTEDVRASADVSALQIATGQLSDGELAARIEAMGAASTLTPTTLEVLRIAVEDLPEPARTQVRQILTGA